jgi:hypothetical protein
MEGYLFRPEIPGQRLTVGKIENRIFTIRGHQVMLDTHLAELYNVEIKVLNQAVKRNQERFPADFVFQLSQMEWDILRSQLVTLKTENMYKPLIEPLKDERGKHRKFLPFAFTEQGVSMLSGVLHSKTAVKVSIQIMNAFVEMRKFLNNNAVLFERLEIVEHKQAEADIRFEYVFKALESRNAKPENGIFYDGQIFDAHVFISDLIRSAHNSIILIDNYIDESVLLLLTKRKPGVKATIYTRPGKTLSLDLEKHNQQYEPIQLKSLTVSHDRFLIIDRKELYHLGASIKDLGKKWFAFSRLDVGIFELLNKLME